MSDQKARLGIVLPAEAANVALVRHAVAGLAESIGMDQDTVADLKTVVTEACMNVVIHAYPEGEGTIEFEAVPTSDSLVVRVTDTGTGIQPRAELSDAGASLRLGLSLIAALSSSFAISGGVDRGTEITMRLPLSRIDEDSRAAVPVRQMEDGVRIVASDEDLLSPVLSRAVSAFGTPRDLTLDRISDAMLLADAISAAAPSSFGDADLNLLISDGDGGIDISVGPLSAGGEAQLRGGLELPDGEGTVETVADDVRVETKDGGDYVVFRIAGPSA